MRLPLLEFLLFQIFFNNIPMFLPQLLLIIISLTILN